MQCLRKSRHITTFSETSHRQTKYQARNWYTRMIYAPVDSDCHYCYWESLEAKLMLTLLCSGRMSWCSDSQYVCTRNDSMSIVLWISDIRHLELAAILVQKDPLRAAAWDPTCTRLVICTGSSQLYMWTPSGAYCVSAFLPQFSVSDLNWNSNGSCLLLKDKDLFC